MRFRTREVRRSMVTANEIAEITKRSLPKGTTFDQTLEIGAIFYESGMIEVLRGIAIESFEYGMENIPMSRHTKECLEEAVEKEGNLCQNLNEDGLDLLKEFQEAFQNSSDGDAADHFIEGFIRGYQYLKHQRMFGDIYQANEGDTNE